MSANSLHTARRRRGLSRSMLRVRPGRRLVGSSGEGRRSRLRVGRR